MNIPIELIIIVVLFLMFMFWAIWKRITDAWIRRKYNPDNDKSRKGEEHRRQILADIARAASSKPTEQPDSTGTADDTPRPSEPEGRELLPPATSDRPVSDTSSNGSPGDSVGKSKFSFSNPFRRRK